MDAVDTILKIADQGNESNPSDGASSSSLTSTRLPRRTAPSAALKEHQRLFGFKPSKSTSRSAAKRKGKQPGRSTWKKDCICLRNVEQTWRPSSEEKMELAKMGLGLKEAVFKCDGDGSHIHDILMAKFPVLDTCGGYTLLRLSDNSRNLIEIATPDGGMSVPYLKDILNQAKLYIRPLQCDISEEDVKPFILSKVSNIIM